MELNKKGITLVEIIISVALISIVLIFLFNLLIQVNNENSDNEVRSSYLVNQATFIKMIEEDFIDYGLKYGYDCSSINIAATNGTTDANNIYISKWNGTDIKCLTFNFDDGKYAHLFIYKRSTDSKTILSYYRGEFKQSVELEDFSWEDNNKFSIIYDIRGVIVNGETYSYSLPIIGSDGNDYSINLSYYKP